MRLSSIRLARHAAFAASALSLACARPAPTAPEKTAVYETPLNPTAEPVDVEFESVEPRTPAAPAEPPPNSAEPTAPAEELTPAAGSKAPDPQSKP